MYWNDKRRPIRGGIMRPSPKTRMGNIVKIAVIVALLAVAASAQVYQVGARPLGVGGAYVALCRDANATAYNPAAMESYRNLALTASYARLYLGVDDDGLNEGFVGFVNHMGMYNQYGSYGISFTQYFSDVYSQMHVTAGYAKRLYGKPDGPHLALGANFKLIRSGFNDANFTEDFDMSDEVFSSSYSSMAYSADAGLIFCPTDWLSIGAVAKDILEPDISISQSGGELDKQPMTIRGGLALHFNGYNPTLEVEYGMRELNGEADMIIHAGIEKWFGEKFAVRAGMNSLEGDLGAGFSYMHRGERFGWGLDYALLYPALNEIPFTTHHVAFNMRLDPPPPPIRDLELVDGAVEITPTRSIIGNELEIRATVENRGEIDENNVRVSVYYQDENGKWRLAVPVQKFDFETAEIKQLSWKWVPPAKGHYTLFVSVDDKGNRLPTINGKVPEEDEENNTGVGEFDVFLTPEGIVSPRDHVLTVSKLTLYQEEEPLIPVVFFEEGSSDVDSRFDDMLQIVANRLKENPDVKIYIRGYYDAASESSATAEQLAVARGQAVGDRLKALGAPSGQINVVRSGYYAGKSRAGEVDDQFIPHDRKLMSAENRRTELSSWFTEGKSFLVEVPVRSGNIVKDGFSALTSVAGRMELVLENNPEAIVLVESYYNVNTPESANEAFEKAATVGRYIRTQLIKEELADRVRIHASLEPESDPEIVLVFPNSEGVIWRPKIGDRVFTDYQVEGNEENLVQISASVDAGVDSFAVTVVDDEGDQVRMLAAGKGEIPSGLAWDWRDNAGEMLDFDDKYFARLDIRDKMGETFMTYSDTLAIEVSKQSKRVESLVIVLFKFDEETPAAKFLESRVEYVADKFIKRAELSNEEVLAEVTGHTDSIGPEYRNIALSKERAEKELNNLRRYMMYLLDIESESEFDEWLEKNNVSLKSKGLGESEPYEILRWTGETVERVQLGDNSTPEGRSVNRRVLLHLETIGGKK